MRSFLPALLLAAGLLAPATAFAQPPGGGGGPGGPGGGGKQSTVEEMVAKVMAYDANKDGKLAKEELTDARLLPLFERADADKDGVVTTEELTALVKKEMAAAGTRGGGGPGGGGPGGGGPGGGGPGGRGTMVKPGDIFTTAVAGELKLTDDQKKKLDELQKDVDAKLDKLLTDDQKKALKEMRERGPGGPPGGGQGGPGSGPGGGPGGAPPGGGR